MDSDKFYDEVYQVVRLIPAGRVTSYGAIAKFLGWGTSRMVGRAMGISTNVLPPVPAHRVVNHAGYISGSYQTGVDFREEKLNSEGIEIDNKGRVIDFKKKYWDPYTEFETEL